jgi:hypothetical protein
MAYEVGGTDFGYLTSKEKPLEGRQPFAAVHSLAVQLFLSFTGSRILAQARNFREVHYEHHPHPQWVA